MRLRVTLLVRLPLALSLVSLLPCHALAAGEPDDGQKTEPNVQEMQPLEKAVEQAQVQRLSAEEALLKLYEQTRVLKATIKSLTAKADEARETLKVATQNLKTEEQAARQSEEAQKAAEHAAEEASKLAEAAQEAAKEAARRAEEAAATAAQTAKQAESARNTFAEKSAALEEIRQKIAAATGIIDGSESRTKKLQSRLGSYVPDVDKAVAAVVSAAKREHEQRRLLSEALIRAGKQISFSEQIAPIFASRCLACHNARAAKGRLNLETYASLKKGGESGDEVDPGDGESSMLYMLVEDGTMPKDADPLTKEQLNLIRQWIDLGAALDYGADPNALLTDLIPKPRQPSPPDAYRVPIPVTAICFSPDGAILATSGYHEVLFWDAQSGKLLRRVTNLAERIGSIAFSPDGMLLAVAAGTPGQLGEVKLFRVADGHLEADLVTASDSELTVAFSPDGTYLAVGGADRTVRVFDVLTKGQRLLIEDHADWVMDVAWSPDGNQLATASRDKTAKVFDAKTGESKVTFTSHGEPVYGVSFTADGKQVVTSGGDKKIRIWNVADAKQVREIGGFGGDVFRVVVTSDGRIFDCSSDTYVRVHQIADGKQIATCKGHTDWVYCVAYHAGTNRLASGSYDGEVRIWNPADATLATRFIAAPGYKPSAVTASAEELQKTRATP